MFSPPKIQMKDKLIKKIILKSDKLDFIILVESNVDFVKDLMNSGLKKDFVELDKFSLSHGGFIHFFYRNTYQDNQIKYIGNQIQSVIVECEKVYNDQTFKFYICGCHLYPFPENSERRLNELLLIREKIPKDSKFIIIGDTNMRENEVKYLERC